MQTLPQAVFHNIDELLYLHCEVSYDEVLDVAFIWKHNGQVIRDKIIKDPRVVSSVYIFTIF